MANPLKNPSSLRVGSWCNKDADGTALAVVSPSVEILTPEPEKVGP